MSDLNFNLSVSLVFRKSLSDSNLNLSVSLVF